MKIPNNCPSPLVKTKDIFLAKTVQNGDFFYPIKMLHEKILEIVTVTSWVQRITIEMTIKNENAKKPETNAEANFPYTP